MNNDDSLGIIIILGIIAIAIFGGAKGAQQNGMLAPANQTPEQKQQNLQNQINTAKNQVDALKLEIKATNEAKTRSIYYGKVYLSYVNRSTDPNQEYLALQVPSYGTTTIPITGWRITSTNTGNSVAVPQGTYLFFMGTGNSETNINLVPGDTMYVVSGISPVGVSFKTNKCSGYMEQFQKFYPYINKICPLAKNEGISAVPPIVPNDACLDYINGYPKCTVPTNNLPNNWTYECTNYIQTRMNYPYCINTHKGDLDFDQHEWRVYLKRSTTMWKQQRENIVLYDNLGKIVATLTY